MIAQLMEPFHVIPKSMTFSVTFMLKLAIPDFASSGA